MNQSHEDILQELLEEYHTVIPQRVTRAAVLLDGTTYTGIRHHLILCMMHREGLCVSSKAVQGFTLENGKFVDRREAELHAKATGQITTIIGGVLTSEDLWNNKGEEYNDINKRIYRKESS